MKPKEKVNIHQLIRETQDAYYVEMKNGIFCWIPKSLSEYSMGMTYRGDLTLMVEKWFVDKIINP